jgi:pilus assembly protein CpaB
MTRQKRTFIVLGVAVLAAFVASYGVYTAVSRVSTREVEIATVDAVVAAKAMPVGTRVAATDVKVVKWPARTPLPNGFTTATAVVDRGVIVPIGENEPVTEAKLAPKAAGAGLPPSITPGMRAMSVKVDEVVGVAGFVVPGTRVDVLAILHPPQQTATNDSLAKVVVSNVQVLTAGTRYDQERAQKDAKAIPSTVVTLLVTPGDAQKVALAQAEGRLMLALRNPLDTETADLAPIATSGLIAGAATVPVPVATTGIAPAPRRPRPAVAALAPAPAPPKPYTVVAIRAAKATEEVVR